MNKIKKKILIINQGGSDNLGDQAIKESLTMLLEHNEFETYFQDFTSYNYSYTFSETENNQKNIVKSIIKSFVKIFTPSKLRWYIKNRKIFNVLKEEKYDAVVIGGGQLINKNKTFPYALKLWAEKVKKLSNKPKLFLFAVGAMDNFSSRDKNLYKKTLKKFDDIYVRDEYSQNALLSNFGIESNLTYDVAFSYKKYKQTKQKDKIVNSVLLGFTSFERHKKYNKDIVYEDYLKEYENKIVDLQLQNKDITLFYTTVSDLKTLKEIKSNLPDIYVKIAKIENLDDLIYYLNISETVISPRMHALILGKIYGCNVVPELISDKIVTFANKYLNVDYNLNDIIEQVEKDLKTMIKIV